MQDVFESPPRNALEEAIGPISLAQEKAAMAGGTRRTVQSELASVKTKDTHSSREGCKAEQMNTGDTTGVPRISIGISKSTDFTQPAIDVCIDLVLSKQKI
uniref:Uncharacterized protein n=1 Tax=Vespula pensylvanica TaxID=30213 RepID=A0A834NRN1_VESPE|nr:hypothetical protein H0235_011252 [Vespula pensylvanica]